MIYMLEDDENIRNFVLYALNNSVGLNAKGFGLPSQFWEAIKKKTPDLILLDVMLPEEDGLEVLKKLRNKSDTKDVPIIMLTAKSTVYDKVLGLDSGADDYIAKPFETMELISRINVWLRRTTHDNEEEYEVDGLYINPKKHIVKVYGEEVMLTLKEYEMLCLFVRNRGTVYNRNALLQNIWGYDFDGENRTVDVHIRSLRNKLGECGQLIETVRGVGYRLNN